MAKTDKNLDEKVEKIDNKNKKDKPKSQEEILVDQLCEGIETYKERSNKVFLSAITAGLEIGFSFLLLGILYTILEGRVSKDVIFYLLAFAYPIGFIIVVLGRSMLFTEQTSLLALPVLHSKRTIKELIKLWGLVIAGNMIGGFIFAFLCGHISMSLGIITQKSIGEIASHVTKPSVLVILGSAIFAGWLMALLSWLLSSAKDTISRIVVIYIITFTVGFAGFHHSIVGNVEVFAGLIFTDKISFSDYLSFQSIALIGNAIGGVIFVAILRYRAFTSKY